jgi:hypothetical protein
VALSAGTRLGPYEILEPLGAGGMGEVYRARDTRLGRDVAVKLLPEDRSSDPDRLRRFETEARTVASLNHPHILALYDVGTHEGVPYAVTELLEGHTLRSVVEGGPVPFRKVVDYGLQVCRGLAAAHEHGIVHRDLKPERRDLEALVRYMMRSPVSLKRRVTGPHARLTVLTAPPPKPQEPQEAALQPLTPALGPRCGGGPSLGSRTLVRHAG